MYLVNPLDFDSSLICLYKKSLLCIQCPQIITKLISFNTIRYIHCSHYVTKQIRMRMCLQKQTVTVIDFTIGHNQLYIRQNGNTIWIYIYTFVFILLSTYVIQIVWFQTNGPERMVDVRTRREIYGPGVGREKGQSFGFSINLLICKSKTQSTKRLFPMRE